MAIQLQRSPEWLATALACWRLEASWFPLSPEGPLSRNTACLQQARPAVIVDSSGIHGRADSSSALASEAYVIFTSGSTGAPKGVVLSHPGLLSMLQGQAEQFEVVETSRVFWGLSPLFDASISDWGTALLSGATLCIRNEAEAFSDALDRSRPTHADIPPSLLAALEPTDFPTLSTVIVGGEVTAPGAIRKWADSRRVLNVYGPTEATVCASTKVCEQEWIAPNIGAPLPGVSFLIDGDESAEQGELWIGGAQVGLGYLSANHAPQDRFTTVNGLRFYKTGDLVRRERTGFVFLGRTDRQLKVRGKLIAPEEVEAALLSIEGIREAHVQATDTGKLVAHVAPETPPRENLRATLAEALPDWMIPSEIVVHASLPRSQNGKVDVKRLPASSGARDNRVIRALEAVAGQTVREELSFRDNGLDSLDALRASVVLCKSGHPVSPQTLMNASRLDEDYLANATSGMRLRDLSEFTETHFADDIVSRSATGAVLLTGVTGGLGRVLLKELALDGREVICLVRPDCTGSARERFNRIESELGSGSFRVTFVSGDIACPALGMNLDDYALVSEKIAHVLNCAADVSLSSTFNQLKRTNVDSIGELAKFCAQAGAVLHQISSLSVIASQWPRPSIAEERPLEPNDSLLFGGYAQTKAAAEFALYKAHIPWVIYRLGLLLNEDGTNSPEMLRTELATPGPNSNDLKFDVTPTSWCAKVIVSLMRRAHPREIRHIAGNRPLSAADIQTHTGTGGVSSGGEGIPSSLYLASGIEFSVAQRDAYDSWAGPQPDAELTLRAHLEANR